MHCAPDHACAVSAPGRMHMVTQAAKEMVARHVMCVTSVPTAGALTQGGHMEMERKF